MSGLGMIKNLLGSLKKIKKNPMDYGKNEKVPEEVLKLADDKFDNLFKEGSADNILENKSITRNPKRYKLNLKNVDNLRGGEFPIVPTRLSAFDTEANNLAGFVKKIPNQKTRHETIMSKNPIIDEDGFPVEYYHGTTNVFKGFGTGTKKVNKDSLVNPDNNWGDWSWHSPSSAYTRPYSRNELGKEIANSNTHQNYLFPQKIFDAQNPKHFDELSKWMHNKPGSKNMDKSMIDGMFNNVADRRKGFWQSEQPFMRDFLESNGYDAQMINHAGTRNIMMKNPSQIKNTNNRGTFDLTNSDTMKAIVPVGLGFGSYQINGGNQ